jgi:HEPN domain-containing protein
MPRHEVRELVDRWLAYARDDLNAAEELKSSGTPARISCFHAQQAAEKAMKAVFVLEQIDYPYTHDLVQLAEALPSEWRLQTRSADLADLSRWAVESRYPMLDEPGSGDSDRALATARAVVEEVTRRIAPGAAEGNG